MKINFKNFLVLLILFILSLSLLQNRLQYNIADFHQDEAHTLIGTEVSFCIVFIFVLSINILDNTVEPFSKQFKNDLDNFKSKYLSYNQAFIRRAGGNKHLTNYILPMNMTLVERHGDYFLFNKN